MKPKRYVMQHGGADKFIEADHEFITEQRHKASSKVAHFLLNLPGDDIHWGQTQSHPALYGAARYVPPNPPGSRRAA